MTHKTDPNHISGTISNSDGVLIYAGLTKREHFAALAMQGLAANPETGDWLAMQIAEESIRQADALIKELNKGYDE